MKHIDVDNVCIIFAERKRNLVHTSLKPSKPNRYIAVFSSSSEPPVVFLQKLFVQGSLMVVYFGSKNHMNKMTLVLAGYSQIIMFSKVFAVFFKPKTCFFVFIGAEKQANVVIML